MPDPIFEWDHKKSEANRRKHGISFELAKRVFADSLAERRIEGDDHGEIRWQIIGQVGGALIRVTFTEREEEETEIVRIISARRLTRREHRAYEGNT